MTLAGWRTAALPGRRSRVVASALGRIRPDVIVVRAGIVLLPLLVVPSAGDAFRQPKLYLLGGLVLGGVALAGRRLWTAWLRMPAPVRYAVTAWIIAIGGSSVLGRFASLDPILLAVLGAAWGVVVMAVDGSTDSTADAIEIGATLLAVVAIAQAWGLDIFTLLGWTSGAGPHARMRVYGTLGNPNFVAAFLCGAIPLALARGRRDAAWSRAHIAAAAIQLFALVLTGSRAPLVAAGAVTGWWAILGRRHAPKAASLAALCLLVAGVLVFPAGRALGTKLRGRLYVWRVAAVHVVEHPLLGLGPGGFGAMYPAWDLDYWRSGRGTDAERVYRGITDHAHNDYLEFTIDSGVAGGLAWVAVIASLLWSTKQAVAYRQSPVAAGASAGAVAMSAVALVDFPFARPAEVFLWWSLWAICLAACGPAAELRGRRGTERLSVSTC